MATRVEMEDAHKKFYHYLSMYEYLRKEYPNDASHTAYISNEQILKPIYDKCVCRNANPETYIRHLSSVLDEFLPELEDKLKTALLYKVLSRFEIFYTTEHYNQAFTRIYLNGKFFINTSTFWNRKNIPHPNSSDSTAFKCVGVCSSRFKYQVWEMKDVIHELAPDWNPYTAIGDKFKVGLFPLSSDYRFKFQFTKVLDPDMNTWGFRADYSTCPDIKRDLDYIINIIKQEKIHIACLPEIIIDDRAVNYLKESFEKLKLPFLLLIAGSSHQVDKNGKWQNKMPVMLFINNKVKLFDYYKYQKFTIAGTHLIKKNPTPEKPLEGLDDHFSNPDTMNWSAEKFVNSHLMEDIDLIPTVLVLSFSEIGSIGFVICKDLLPNPNELMSQYIQLIDHLFVVSLNFSAEADFYNKLKGIGKEHKIAAFYVNARGFDPQNNSPSFSWDPQNTQCKVLEQSQEHLIHEISWDVHTRIIRY